MVGQTGVSVFYGRICSPKARRHGEIFSIDAPLSTVTTVGLGGSGAGGGDWYWLRDQMKTKRKTVDQLKPPYRVPSMREIRAAKPNGFTLVSTFTGCGGSDLGFRMAGFRCLWANEFIAPARASYMANCDQATYLDFRDIREIKPEEILAAIKRERGDVDVLEGSPPCSSFSTAGKRETTWGKTKKYSETKQRVDDLFFEYIRILRGLRPRVFVAENVSGLAKGVAKGFFLEILRELKASGYRVECRLLDAQWLGVPQMRQRTIFVGVRDDLKLAPSFPKPFAYRYSIRDAIPWLDGVVTGRTAGKFRREDTSIDRPMKTIHASDKQTRYEVEPKLILGGGNCSKDSTFKRNYRVRLDGPLPTVCASSEIIAGVPHEIVVEKDSWIPPKKAIGKEWDKLKPGGGSLRYRSVQKFPSDAPAPTVTASGAWQLHPFEKRRFSIAELKRLCGFPDDFVLTGTYAQQWERLGRSVPPLMMRAVAERIRDDILLCAG